MTRCKTWHVFWLGQDCQSWPAKIRRPCYIINPDSVRVANMTWAAINGQNWNHDRPRQGGHVLNLTWPGFKSWDDRLWLDVRCWKSCPGQVINYDVAGIVNMTAKGWIAMNILNMTWGPLLLSIQNRSFWPPRNVIYSLPSTQLKCLTLGW